MEQIVYSPTKVRESYDSLNEYAEEAKRRADPKTLPRWGKSKQFNGFTTFKDAVQLGRKGWDTEAESALNLAEQAVSTMRDERIIMASEAIWDVAGAEVDVARWLEGEPEHMIEFPPTPQLRQGDVVTIVRQFAVPGGTNQESIKKYGRLIAGLVLAIEAMGLGTEVWLDATIKGYSGAGTTHLYQRIKVKGAGDMLHAGQLMFGVAHPALLRSLTFGTMDGLPSEALRDAHSDGSGRGQVRSRDDDETALYPEGTLFFDAPTMYQDPVVFLVGELRKLGLVPS